jgi:hypothetical protein
MGSEEPDFMSEEDLDYLVEHSDSPLAHVPVGYPMEHSRFPVSPSPELPYEQLKLSKEAQAELLHLEELSDAEAEVWRAQLAEALNPEFFLNEPE